MLSWVNGGEVEEEEVGQRILTALKQVSTYYKNRLSPVLLQSDD